MNTLLLNMPNGRIAKVKYYYLAPVSLFPNYDEKASWTAERKGVSTQLTGRDETLEYFTKVYDEIGGKIPASLQSVRFFQEKYEKKPFEIQYFEIQHILDAIKDIEPFSFKNAEALFSFCIPDSDF